MKQVFTDYVRSLPPTGEPPDPRSFEEVWEALGRVIESEIRKRGLWESPPSYLGVYGWGFWHEADAGPGRRPAVEDLLAGCYAHIFIRRLDSLKVQLKVKPTIDGLVFLNVRNYLHDKQKQHDPLGFRVFEILRAAVRGTVAAGELHVLAGDPRIRNDTVLSTSERADPAALSTVSTGLVSTWLDTLLPDLVTARGKARKRAVAGLESAILRLPADGVDVFLFGQLIDALKNEVRARWGVLMVPAAESALDEHQGTLVTLVCQSVEERDSFRALCACLAEAVLRVEEPGRARAHLSTLWEFLRTYAAEPEEGAARRQAAGDDLPSGRQLARLLRIPRDRLPGLFSTLGRLVEDCRAAISGRAPVHSAWIGSRPERSGEMPGSRRAP